MIGMDWCGSLLVFFLILFDNILIKIEGFCLICYIKLKFKRNFRIKQGVLNSI